MTRAISEEDRIALNALVDGELDAREAMEWADRIASDPELAAARDAIQASRDAVQALDRPVVSPEFLQRIEGLAAPAAPMAGQRRRWTEGWRSLAAAVVITALIASSATYYLASPRATSFEMLVADAHRRSLLAASPVDILSSDRHTVKPWLDAHLGLSPPAPDLASQGYALVGGRVDVVNQQTLSTLVYRHNEHIISLVARPDAAATVAPTPLASGGYNMLEWRGDGFAFTAVSDLEPDELSIFAADYRAATSPR
jgi:anti-sigma factor RsiW